MIDLTPYKDVKLPTLYQQYIHISRYARWQEAVERRETWPETVKRLIDFLVEFAAEENYELPQELQIELFEAILQLEIMPSMRCMMTAGPALERDHAAAYNCGYLHINRTSSFREILYLLMCGCGIGFSVERQFIQQLPKLPERLMHVDTTLVAEDSKLGWAATLHHLIEYLYKGQIPNWDLSKIRRSGARLHTFGGRASGPGPLNDLLHFTVNIFQDSIKSGDRQLTSIDCHSLVCKIADAVLAGGVRRSALISLSNLSDTRMQKAKYGNWFQQHPHFQFANNSVAYTETPTMEAFFDEWTSLFTSKSGERGIFNRAAAIKKLELNPHRNQHYDFGTNPCSEIYLRDREFCNLAESVVRPGDKFEKLARKVHLSTILGTMQSMLTNFQFLSSKWQENCEEERLLGVSLTGVRDHFVLGSTNQQAKLWLKDLRGIARDANNVYSELFNINISAAITCNKPSGTVSQLTNAASGLHARHAEYYIRTVRENKIDPIGQFMVSSGFAYEDEQTAPDQRWVLSFPINAVGSRFRNDETAIEQLEFWRMYNDHWCEHKPSITISVSDHEWMEVGAYVYNNFEYMSGVSFLPTADHTYAQAPYQECTEGEYNALLEKMPKEIDWNGLLEFEKEDTGLGGYREFACTGDSCEI